jgi:EAL domain-containing protein (putative c-di-GMP-specific phosphodiesterase class I)
MLTDFGAVAKQTVIVYKLPDSYGVLRERTNFYIEKVQAAALMGNGEERVEDAHGRMTAKNAEQIEQLLGEIDIRHYGRTQSLYRNVKDAWQPVGEEYYISFEDFRRERFPKLEIVAAEHFFLALCSTLDQRLFKTLTSTYDLIGGRMINLNVTVASVAGSVFAQFVHRVPHEHRSLLGFELHCGDLFQDFQQTLGAMETLKREGFRVLLDNMTPDMVNYLDVNSFPVDAVKINVSKECAARLDDPKIKAGLSRLPVNKVIFFRCDNKNALAAGQTLGVSVFQGWLIDDLAAKKKNN